ncbi:hypothetical protein C8R43DRAFT_1191867 [Mycena crocata]|nr:hypothetical protein C8R43DRAFT_1210539 [Mycena crocata]KAJ7150568.1 hypothetical protein C8R43DRAFT_1191867 [Mycena crocata]
MSAVLPLQTTARLPTVSNKVDPSILKLKTEGTVEAARAHDLFAIWDKSNARQPAVIVLIASCALIQPTFHAVRHPILRSLLIRPWMRRLNWYLGGSHRTFAGYFNSITAFAGGRERETKYLPKLLNMRRTAKADESLDPVAKPGAVLTSQYLRGALNSSANRYLDALLAATIGSCAGPRVNGQLPLPPAATRR